jgi:hypothetical protein
MTDKPLSDTELFEKYAKREQNRRIAGLVFAAANIAFCAYYLREARQDLRLSKFRGKL